MPPAQWPGWGYGWVRMSKESLRKGPPRRVTLHQLSQVTISSHDTNSNTSCRKYWTLELASIFSTLRLTQSIPERRQVCWAECGNGNWDFSTTVLTNTEMTSQERQKLSKVTQTVMAEHVLKSLSSTSRAPFTKQKRLQKCLRSRRAQSHKVKASSILPHTNQLVNQQTFTEDLFWGSSYETSIPSTSWVTLFDH